MIIKVANTSKQKQTVAFNLSDIKGERTAKTLTLCHDGMDDENSICKPGFDYTEDWNGSSDCRR